jgi:antirestriction protein ArdC
LRKTGKRRRQIMAKRSPLTKDVYTRITDKIITDLE